ncbi:MAG: hypothetical protein IPM30_01270 [Burkholderiales bacterium]|nr:hypothetical protein [Burkholderiales bacterium]
MAGKTKAAALPFMGVSEGFDLVRKVWGVTGLPTLPTPSSMAQFATRLPQTLPSMIAPTLDVEELDKRIADLRAVEQWLNLNLSMLRTTVQSLEVQRNTIATLKSFGGAMLSTAAAQPPPQPAAAATWPYAAGQPMPSMHGGAAAGAAASPPAHKRRRSPRATAAAAAAALPLNPTAWWNTLQEQFTKIAATAAAEAQAAARAAAQPAAAKSPSARRGEQGEKQAPAAAPAPKAARQRKRRSSSRD